MAYLITESAIAVTSSTQYVRVARPPKAVWVFANNTDAAEHTITFTNNEGWVVDTMSVPASGSASKRIVGWLIDGIGGIARIASGGTVNVRLFAED